MNPSTKITLKYSLLGLITSILLVAVFDAIPSIRLFSNEAAVFGVMSALMGLAVKKASSSTERLINNNDEYSDSNQQS
jgi:hypothetical protein